MKRIPTVVLAILFVVVPVLAEEGMWTPQQLPEIAGHLKELGLHIDPGRLSDLTGDPMNAVISLGGCTASFVSPNGLVITNHHCAYGSIQYNSTAEKNLLESGFYATSLAEELPAAPGSRVYVTVEFRDVTPRILDGLDANLPGAGYHDEIEKREKAAVAECEKEPGFRCRVASYYGGVTYSLVRQLEIRDVRLVYAPPSGIGKFGGDVDNWMWPRHTGDFSFLRAYVSPDGKPADYSKNNVPYQPQHYLKVARHGVRDGDFVMVAGYPGSTDRYRLASEVENTFTWEYPEKVRLYGQWLDTIQQATASHPDADIKYAGLVAAINNTVKNNEGMLAGYAKSDMLEEKEQLETNLQQWIHADHDREAEYGDPISKLEDTLQRDRQYQERELVYRQVNRSALLTAAKTLYRLAKEKEKPDLDRRVGYQERDVPRIEQSLRRIDRTFDPAVDRAVLKHFLLVYQNLPSEQRIPALDTWFDFTPGASEEGKIDAALDKMYSGTRLADSSHRVELMQATPAALEASSDPFIQMAVHLYKSDVRIERDQDALEGELEQLRPRYMKALLAYLKTLGKTAYPDANSTLRVSVGVVKGYSPADAVEYRPFTSLKGVIAKDTGQEPFDTPPATLEAMRGKKGGEYSMPSLGTVPVNFLSTLDTTGGNSGSPTLNSRAELVGLLFDGNWESVIADWTFLPDVTRSIHVDIRYVLWLMEEVDHTDRLLEEMSLKPEPATQGK